MNINQTVTLLVGVGVIVIVIIIIIIIIIIPYQSGLDSLFKGFASRLHLFGPQFSFTFFILMLLILVTCRSHFDLYLLSFLSTASTFSSSKISSFLLWFKKGEPGSSSEKKISSRLTPIFFDSFFSP